MATMKFKNKFDVAFKQMLADAEKVGGVPKEIVIDPMEAWGIINEMRWTEVSESWFDVSSQGGDEFTIRRTFWSKYKDMPKDEAEKIVKMMIHQKYIINYKGVPLRVVVPPKKEEPDKNIEAPKADTVPDVPKPAGPIESRFTNPAYVGEPGRAKPPPTEYTNKKPRVPRRHWWEGIFRRKSSK